MRAAPRMLALCSTEQHGSLRDWGSNRLRELVRPGGTNRLRELLRLYACRDAVAPIDEDAFGTRASEPITRARGEPRTEAAEIANFSDTQKSDPAFP
jgi:hypothetical protein